MAIKTSSTLNKEGIVMKRLMFLLSFAVFSITMSIHAHAASIVTDGLVSYWTFDRDDIVEGTVKDVWGKNDAMIIGNPEIVGGLVNQALKFDGIDDFVNLTTLGDFGTQLGSSTFEAWIKVGLKEKWQALFKVIDSECMGWGIDFNWGILSNPFRGRENELLIRDANELLKDIKENVTIGYFVRNHFFWPGRREQCWTPIFGDARLKRDEKWHHIVYIMEVQEIERESRFYLDGEQTSFRKIPYERAVYIPFTDPIYLGAASIEGDPRNFFEGAIDEVRIYNRPLTESEVTRNFKSNIGLSVEPTQKLSTVWGALKSKR